MVNKARNFLINHEAPIIGPVRSIKGPWLVLDPIDVRSCVPRVPTQQILGGSMIAPPPPPLGIIFFENTPEILGLRLPSNSVY